MRSKKETSPTFFNPFRLSFLATSLTFPSSSNTCPVLETMVENRRARSHLLQTPLFPIGVAVNRQLLQVLETG